MDQQNRPKSREVHKVSGSGDVNKRGSGLGTGPVGSGGAHQGRPTSQGPIYTNNTNNYRPTRNVVRRRGGIGSIVVILILVFLFFKFFGGGGGSSDQGSYFPTPSQNITPSNASSSSSSLSTIMNLLSSQNYETSASDYSSYTAGVSNTAKLDTTVAKGSRDKRTEILGNGKDKITFMVYMCGTDLESKHGMASSDLREMCSASLSDNINIIVYTGGCSQWQTQGISNRVNQIYKVESGRLVCLEDDMGSKAMTDPATLTEFIKYCTKNYPANRQNLILWDHGSGSISGYGYDEKNKLSGSMTLSGINKALKNAGAVFDFIGFDACLMATVENGLMLSNYADYMIASEETEPGVGWYYTNWLTKLSNDTSMSTIDIGKNIVDDFVDVCDRKCNGQKTTLSVVDLAELSNTVPKELTSFAKSTQNLIANDEYKTVSDARYNTREFAQSSKIDQIDLVHFAKNLDTKESNALADALLGAVKYNRHAPCINNAYGLSIYFPYKKASKVDQVVSTYNAIGMDEEYARCIQDFASLEVCGQVSTGGSNSAIPSLLNMPSSSSNMSFDSVSGLLGSLFSGETFSLGGFDTSEFGFLTGSSLTSDRASKYISNNYFDASKLVWTKNSDGDPVIALSEKDWSMVETLDLNVFYDDGEGYIDLGLDNVFSFDNEGNLYGRYDGSWLSLNGQIVPYYHTDTTEEGDKYTISGYIPAYLNGDRVEINVIFDNDRPYGYITGARFVYTDTNDTETVAKDIIGLNKGDILEFICDYYTYEGEYIDSYYLGEPMTLGDTIEIANIDLKDKSKINAVFKFTDLYQQNYWTPVIP